MGIRLPSIENVPFGHWIIAEIASPSGLYSISDEPRHVYVGTDGQVIEIQIDNTLIHGTVQVIKTEAMDPSNHSEEETDTGFYEMGKLLAKGYFVKEKAAPEGFEKDPNAYYFSITEDGQVVVIENGVIEITGLRSSDGKSL